MELYESEEQQVEAIKKWFAENGRSIVVGLIIGIGAILGWNGWQSYQKNQAREASNLFQEILNAEKMENRESLVKIGERLKADHPDSAYAAYAGFFLAKQAVESGNLEAARKELESIITGSSDPSIRNIARLRLLRILLAEGKGQETLDLINSFDASKSDRFAAAFEELKGDAYLALAKEREARSAYKRATELGRASRFLDLKIEDLPAPHAPETPQ